MGGLDDVRKLRLLVLIVGGFVFTVVERIVDRFKSQNVASLDPEKKRSYFFKQMLRNAEPKGTRHVIGPRRGKTR